MEQQHLSVTDSRTGKEYTIPIEGDYVRAADIAKIGAPEGKIDLAALQAAHPLRVIDNGFANTACMESSITHMCVYLTLQLNISTIANFQFKLIVMVYEAQFDTGTSPLRACFMNTFTRMSCTSLFGAICPTTNRRLTFGKLWPRP